MSETTTVEFEPSLLDKAAGFVGRLGSIATLHAERPTKIYDHISIHEHLDRFDPIKDYIRSANLDPDGSKVQNIIPYLQHGPALDKPVFIDGLTDDENRPILTIQTRVNPIDLPVRNIVYAPGLKNWHEDKDGDRRQIRRLARKPTAKPIEKVVAYVQPNGLVLFAAEDDSYQLAAAHLRHDQTISVNGSIAVRRLPRDIIERTKS